MKKTFMASLLLAALATSCSEDLNVGNNIHTETLTASVTAEQTRAAFTSNGKFYWSSGDQIGVTTTTSEKMFSSMTLQSGAGEASATFKGGIRGSIGSYAVYPFSKDHGLDGTKLTYSFPATYSLDKVDLTYYPEQKDGNSYNPAMWAYIQGNSVTFKHLGGVFMIKIAKMPCTDGTLEFSTKQNLCGNYTADLSDSNTEPQLVNTDASATGTGKAVTISFKGATVDQPGIFYIPVPTGEYDAYLTLKDGNNKEELKDVLAGSFTIARRDLYGLTISEATIDAGVATQVASADAVTTELAKSDNVALTAAVSGTGNTVTIPEASTTTGSETQAAKTLSFSNVAAGASIKIADANTSTAVGEAAKSVKELTVTIPNVKTSSGESAPSLEVAMPNSTVTVGGNAGVATINELTASTAENTLIVSSGVTINKLIVKKGNVRINKGATVSTISLDGVASATVYYEEGAKVPTSWASGITAIGIPVGTQVSQIITTQAQFAAAMKTGGNYVLGNDVTVGVDSTAKNTTVVIDLNQKTLSNSGRIYAQDGGTLTLKNGNIKGQMLYVNTGGTLNIDKVTYNGECIFVRQNSNGTNVSVTNSTINGNAFSITTNASTNPVASNCKMTLENSTFAAVESGALLNIPLEATMTNCIFSGNHHGALLRGGTYTIEGCTFKLNATLAFSDGENMWMKAWQDGNRCAYAALTIGNYKNASYAYETNVKFVNKKSTTVVEGTYATSFPAVHVCANNYNVTITGFADYLTVPTSGCKSPSVEYGTDKITVDGSVPEINAKVTTSARRK